jgi:hypothetical protein
VYKVDTWLAIHVLEDLLPPQELEFEHNKNFKETNPPCMVQIHQILTFVGRLKEFCYYVTFLNYYSKEHVIAAKYLCQFLMCVVLVSILIFCANL